MFFVNGKRVLHVAFIKNTLLYTKLYVLLLFRDKDLFCGKKLFNIFIGLCIYLIQKSVKMILENHVLKSFWTAYYMLCRLVYIIFPLISMT